jgi:hypothetical protein
VVLVLVVLLVVVARHILVLPITLILGPSSYGSKFWVVTDLGFDETMDTLVNYLKPKNMPNIMGPMCRGIIIHLSFF